MKRKKEEKKKRREFLDDNILHVVIIATIKAIAPIIRESIMVRVASWLTAALALRSNTAVAITAVVVVNSGTTAITAVDADRGGVSLAAQLSLCILELFPEIF